MPGTGSGGIEVRRSANGSGNTISGSGIVYDALSQDLGGFQEKFKYGGVRTEDTRMLFDHDYASVLGRESAGTLSLRDTPQGLKYSCDLPDTQLARDLAVSLSHGDISGVSFGFVCDDDSWAVENDVVVRTETAARVFELSIVADPAYLQSTVNLRSLPSKYRHLVKRDAGGIADADCDCSCDNCLDDNCEACSASQCEDTRCLDRNCPMQDETASRAQLLQSLLLRHLL